MDVSVFEINTIITQDLNKQNNKNRRLIDVFNLKTKQGE